MTGALYLDDSDRRSFEATVERALDDRVALDRTCFYPEGGGQPADHGTLRAGDEEWHVTDVRKKDVVYHTVDGDPPAEGTTVEGVLDWDRRYAHMRYHTAQHLLSALLLEEFDARTTGNQLYADRARIDVEYDRFTDDDLRTVTERMNDLIDREMAVRWYEMDREVAERELDTDRTRIDLLPDSIRELRIVEIGPEDDPYDRTACAGTHVANTAEIGRFEATGRETKGSDEERLSFVLHAE
ncbi:alanyl-tRNA editing protein [Halobacteriales archaeon QS_8_69_26]|nr:MAG: alanyl-tRNA editing protein [Halobacteriales archaeon QS_8_69_26]